MSEPRAGALAAFLVGILACAGAADAAITPKVRKACAADYKRLCPAYKINTPQLRACMEAKSAEISSMCIEALIDAGEVDRRRSARR